MKLKLRTLFVGLLVGGVVAQSSFARMISDISFHYSGSEGIKAKVQFEKGNEGDDHVLYVVWDSIDHGENLHDWPNANAVRIDPIAPDATEAIVVLPPEAKASGVFRAFFAEPKRTGNFDKLITSIRSEGGAYIDTGHCCSKDCEILLDFSVPQYSDPDINGGKYDFLGASPNGKNETKFAIRLTWYDYRYRCLYYNSGYTVIQKSSKDTNPTRGTKRTLVVLSPYLEKCALKRQDGYDFSVPCKFNNSSVTDPSSCSLALFGTKYNDGSVGKILPNGIIYNSSIKEKGVFVRKMYPAVKDGAAGIWDAIEDKFYTSPGNEFLTVDLEGNSFEDVSFGKAFNDVIIPRDRGISFSRCESVSLRRVSGLSFVHTPDGGTRGSVTLSSGKSGDVDILYLAWGDADCGENMEDWPNVRRIGALKASETSKSFVLNNELNPSQYYRAFLATAWHPCVPKALRFVRSEGKAYINTGYLCATNTRISIKFQLPGFTNKTVGEYFGMFSTGTKYGVRALKTTQSRLVEYGYNKSGTTAWMSWMREGLDSLSAGAYEVALSVFCGNFSASYEWEGELKTYSTGVPKVMQGVDRATLPLYLFASCNEDLTPYNMMPWGNLFGASIQEDGVFKRQFYPCVKDGVAGLCDQVENKFYPSLGEADFLATDSSGAAIAEGAFPVETPFTSSATVAGKYRKGFSVIVR
jgi:hypothetical protein